MFVGEHFEDFRHFMGAKKVRGPLWNLAARNVLGRVCPGPTARLLCARERSQYEAPQVDQRLRSEPLGAPLKVRFDRARRQARQKNASDFGMQQVGLERACVPVIGGRRLRVGLKPPYE